MRNLTGSEAGTDGFVPTINQWYFLVSTKTTNGTATKHQDEIEQAIRDSIKLGIGDAISSFGLLDPKLYRAIVESSDFFHNPKFPWNQTALPEHYGAGLRY